MLKVEDFKSPSKEFRPAPLWSWNDKLDDEELLWQVAELDEKGWNFFIHPRPGVATSYLTDEWMDKVELVVKEAAKRGMQAWLYDENSYPSGFAEGIVSAQKSAYRSKCLVLKIGTRLDKIEETVRIFKCDMKDGMLKNIEPVVGEELQKPGKIYLHFYLHRATLGEPWFSGYCYVDVLNSEAVEAFLKSTYEAYYKRIGKWFGSVVPGIFTDEPNFSPMVSKCIAIPWTEHFPEYFKQKNGYDIRDYLPSLFLNVGDYMKIRYDYWSTLTDLFVETYSKKISEWCEEHNLKFTGHYLSEDTLLSQLKVTGACMPHYEYQHVPGIDQLGRKPWKGLREHIHGRGNASILTVKQVCSVANQLGKRRVLSETYGCSGQNLSFEDRKWIGDWLYVLGVNFLDHHIPLYSMKGRRKRDHPPNQFYPQPWWKYNRLTEDYYTRLSYALSCGKRIVDILVIHPIGSAWAVYSPINSRAVEKLDASLEWLQSTLLENHRDFEFGDEKLMGKYAKVDGANVIVGRCSYKAVIIPPSITITENTFNLLKNFAENGGILIAIRPTPTRIDGVKSEKINELISKAVVIDDRDEKALLKALESLPPRVQIVNSDGKPIREIWYHLRRDNTQQIIFLANVSREKSFKAIIRVQGEGRVQYWNPFNGEIKDLPSTVEEGYTRLELTFPPVGSYLLVIDETKGPLPPKETGEAKRITEIVLNEEWNYKVDLNAITLDYCKFKIEDERWSPIMPHWKVQRSLMESINLAPHGTLIPLFYGARFTLRYEFESALERTEKRRIFLVLEQPEKFIIRVNGKRLTYYKDESYWLEKNFKMLDIKDFVVSGVNIIELEGKVDFETEIESIYIVGDFAVENKDNKHFRLVEKPRKLKSGNLVTQGFPFYAGTISLLQEVEIPDVGKKVFLNLEKLNAILANVIVNGKEVGQIFMKPYEIEVTNFIKKGKNEIEIQLINSLRNLLGPHHHAAGELYSVWPDSFTDELNWTDTYNFVPFGLKGAKIKIVF